MIFQELDPGETLSPKAKLRATEGRAKVSACAFNAGRSPGGKIFWKVNSGALEATRNAITPVTNYSDFCFDSLRFPVDYTKPSRTHRFPKLSVLLCFVKGFQWFELISHGFGFILLFPVSG